MKTMRPLFHPSIEDVTVEAILHAFSDPVRVAIFADIAGSNCSQNCTTFRKRQREGQFPNQPSRSTSKPCEKQALIRGERRGVEMQNTSRCAEIDQRFPGLIAAIVNAHNIQSRAKSSAGDNPKRKPAKRSGRTKERG